MVSGMLLGGCFAAVLWVGGCDRRLTTLLVLQTKRQEVDILKLRLARIDSTAI